MIYMCEWNSVECSPLYGIVKKEQEPFLIVAPNEDKARIRAHEYMFESYGEFEYDIYEYEEMEYVDEKTMLVFF